MSIFCRRLSSTRFDKQPEPLLVVEFRHQADKFKYSRIINKSLLSYTTSQLLHIPLANFNIFPSEIHSDSKAVVQKLCNFNKNKKINIKHSVFILFWLITFLKCLYKVLLMSAILFLRQLFER